MNHDVLRSALRRWYAVLVVLIAAAALFYQLSNDGGTYSTRTVITFQLAGTSDLDRFNGLTDKSVISLASAVATQVNNGRSPQGYGVSDAPLYGAGIRQGSVISLPNGGNQWVSIYKDAEIEVQVVGRTHAWTEATQQSLVKKILATAKKFEGDPASIKPDERITVSVVPVTTQIDYVGVSRTGELAAAGGLFLAAMIVGLWLATTVDRISSRVHVRRTRPSTTARTTALSLGGSNA